ncbi:endoplasmin [Phyllopteryx taeniolatus]|uniref:endoplasmin n=1 Tax=Phyllopteryx taeniolatus TaxID=161469 RepID=UPI002AD2B6A7|nr:endoplasmin [Phyllopteryx taeniolatus]
MTRAWAVGLLIGLLAFGAVKADDEVDADGTVDEDLGKSRDGSKTDDEIVQREEEAIQLDGLNAAQIKELREKSEKHAFQAEVNRMMKLIINSLYKNKEIFLRELISNASDALDKIRLLSLTDDSALASNEELTIKIKSDKEKNMLHITDTGIGMTKEELVKNLGTIAKSGTSEFLNKMTEMQSEDQSTSELIGQFGVGFYSAFLVADEVVVTSKHNNGTQHIWESDSNRFSVIEDPRGDTLGRGTTITLVMKEEASDYLELETIKNLVRKYSQFINFPIYVWASKTETVEEPVDEDAEATEEPQKEASEDEAEVEEEEEDEDKGKPKTKKVEKTVWDWELMNDIKPIWQRPAKEVEDDEYNAFYKTFSKDNDNPLAHIHFTAEGEVTFKSILFVPTAAPRGLFDEYGSKKNDYIKLFVRRVFITDDFNDMMPKYLNFVKGVVDSDDLPLNVSRETLQQHKLLKVIRKKLVRKTLDMIKKIAEEVYDDKFWKEFGTNIKLGVIEDHSNRTRLAKLLRFNTSNSDTVLASLEQYVERMKDKQDKIYFMAGTNRKEAEASPFVERLLKKGYEVIYLTEPVDEYCIQALPEFDGKRFQNVAKEGVKFDESDKAKEKREAQEKEYEPLATWLKDKALKDKIEKAVLSQRLTNSPCALVASQYGWSGNMERIMKAQAYQTGKDISTNYYASQKKTLEINPKHPLIKQMLKRVNDDADDQTAADLATVLFETATLRSGYQLADTKAYGDRIERMLRLSMNIPLEEQVEEEPEEEPEEPADTEDADDTEEAGDEEEVVDDEDDDEEKEAAKTSPKIELCSDQRGVFTSKKRIFDIQAGLFSFFILSPHPLFLHLLLLLGPSSRKPQAGMSIEIPAGLTELLQRFTVEVLRNQPGDLLDFALQYFTRLNERRDGDEDDGEPPPPPPHGQPRGGGTGKAVNFLDEAMHIDSENGEEDDDEDDEDFQAPIINRFIRRASVCAEAFNPDEDDEDKEPRVAHPKTDEQRQRLQEACRDILLFKNLDPEEMSQVLDAMFEKFCSEGEHVIDQDDDGDNFYVIERGTFNIFVKADSAEKLVGRYDNRGSFGELALMYNTPRAATIVATLPGALWCLDRLTFRRIIVKNNAKKRKLYEAFIETLPLLTSLELSERMKVVDVISTKVYCDSQQIIAQGELADCFYIVESGQVRITIKRSRTKKEQDDEEVEIARCARGQYFGELALVTNKPRAASAYAVGSVKCLVMDVNAFERLLGPCMDIMKRNIANYEEQLLTLFGGSAEMEKQCA